MKHTIKLFLYIRSLYLIMTGAVIFGGGYYASSTEGMSFVPAIFLTAPTSIIILMTGIGDLWQGLPFKIQNYIVILILLVSAVVNLWVIKYLYRFFITSLKYLIQTCCSLRKV